MDNANADVALYLEHKNFNICLFNENSTIYKII